MQERLVEPGLILLGHQQHLVLVAVELLRQLTLLDATIHPYFGELLPRKIRIFHHAREGHQRLHIRVAFLVDVVIKGRL